MRISYRRAHLLGMAMIVFLGFPVALPASGYAPPDPEAAAQQPVPEHDPEARLRGKSAIEHAEDLGAPEMVRRLMALQALIDMGPDALPARDVVRFVVEHGDGTGFPDAQIDELRLGALSALYAMKAPETLDLLRAKIIDPDFVARDGSYAGLLDAAMQVGLDTEILTRDLMSLTEVAPGHAERLMTLKALPPGVQAPLEEAVFEAPHGDRAIRHFLENLPDMPFLDDAERVDYVLASLDAAGLNHGRGQEILAGIGTEAALDAALSIAPLDGMSRYQLIGSFADGPMSSQSVTEHLLKEVDAAEGDQQIGLVVSVLERILRDDDGGIFPRAMTQMIESGRTAEHRRAGVQRQILFLQRNPDADAATALRPIFALLGDPAASPELRIAADKALRQSPARLAAIDPDYFIAEAVDLIWPASGPAEAELPLALLSPLMSSADLAPRVVDAIEARFAAHLTDWSINPATAIAIGSGTTRGLERSPARETAAIMMGKAIQSTAIDLSYMGPHLARNGAALADLEANTVAGVIGTYEPTIFANDKPASYDFAMEPYMRPMLARPARFAQDPEAKAEWLAFLRRVADLDDDNFSPTARRALDAF